MWEVEKGEWRAGPERPCICAQRAGHALVPTRKSAADRGCFGPPNDVGACSSPLRPKVVCIIAVIVLVCANAPRREADNETFGAAPSDDGGHLRWTISLEGRATGQACALARDWPSANELTRTRSALLVSTLPCGIGLSTRLHTQYTVCTVTLCMRGTTISRDAHHMRRDLAIAAL